MNLLEAWLRRLLLLPPASSSLAPSVDRLHFVVIFTSLLGAAALLVAAMYFCVRYRRRAPRGPSELRPPAPRTPLWVELGLAAGLFTLFVGFWAVGFSQYVSMARPPAGTFDIYVTAKQWMWKFSYPDGSHAIDELYVPAGRPVRLILTSRDVIHSFYVPEYRLKQDVIPGRYTSLWFVASAPGRAPIECAEYCGTQHSRMGGFVVALGADEFGRWLAGAAERREREGVTPEAAADLREQGERVAARYGCLRCHSVDGSPHLAPSFAGLYGATVPLAGGEHVVADVAYLTESMMDPAAKIHAGFEPLMPSYAAYLKPPEVSAVVEYIKALKDAPGRAAPEASATQPAEVPARPAAGAIGLSGGEPRALPEVPWHASEPGLPAPGLELQPLPRATRPELVRDLADAGADAGAGIRAADGGAP